VDGTTGRVYAGRMPLGVPEAVRAALSRLAEWAQSYPVGEQMSAALGEAK
jgi:phage tail protein X